jgi:hypothetical protein
MRNYLRQFPRLRDWISRALRRASPELGS